MEDVEIVDDHVGGGFRNLRGQYYSTQGIVLFLFCNTENSNTTLRDVNKAIDYLEQAIALDPTSESYVFILGALEKKINLMRKDPIAKGKMKARKDCIQNAIHYHEVLKKIDSSNEYKEFIEDYSKIIPILKQSMEPAPEGKTIPPGFYCMFPCSSIVRKKKVKGRGKNTSGRRIRIIKIRRR